MDLGNILRILYNAVISLANSVSEVWDWLTDTHSIFNGLEFDLLNWHIVLIPSFSITPIAIISGTGILLIFGLWLIKALMPMG